HQLPSIEDWLFRITIPSVRLIVIVARSVAVVTLKGFYLYLIEHCAKQLLVHNWCPAECVLGHSCICSPPFDHKNVGINEVCRRPNVDDWRKRRQVDDDIIVLSTKLFEQFPHCGGGQYLAGRYAIWLNNGW